MSGKTNKDEQQKEFKDFLRNMGQKTGSDMDDFEREALEGFALLKEEEALDLKRKTDLRMANEVFTPGTSTSSRKYWLAAASLFLVLGFVSYLFFNRSMVSSEKDLAIKSPSPSNENILTPPSEEFKDKAPDSPQMSAIPEQQAEQKKAEKVKFNPPSSMSNKPVENGGTADLAATETLARADMEAPTTGIHKETESQKEDVVEEADTKRGMALDADKEGAATPSKKAKQLTQTAAPAAAFATDASPVVTNSTPMAEACNYKGGMKGFLAELNAKLGPDKPNKQFQATIFLTESKQIRELIFKGDHRLTVQEQTNLRKAIQAMKDFEFEKASSAYVFEFTYLP
jgi:hypothetical protein